MASLRLPGQGPGRQLGQGEDALGEMPWDMLVTGLATLHHEVLLFAVVGLAIGGLDDLIIDLLFLCRQSWRDLTVYTRHSRMTTASLPPSSRPGRIAIFIPAWGEADVIGPMLRYALGQWGQADYRIFVGVYPNDRATIDAIAPIAQDDPRLILCANPHFGPTTKPDCLNVLWRAMVAEERNTGFRYKAIVLHDAEHVVAVVNEMATQFRVGQETWSNTIRI